MQPQGMRHLWVYRLVGALFFAFDTITAVDAHKNCASTA